MTTRILISLFAIMQLTNAYNHMTFEKQEHIMTRAALLEQRILQEEDSEGIMEGGQAVPRS